MNIFELSPSAEQFDNILTNLSWSVAMATAVCCLVQAGSHATQSSRGGDVKGKAGISGKREQLELPPPRWKMGSEP